jgi:DNA-binding transcriptional MerR regulator
MRLLRSKEAAEFLGLKAVSLRELDKRGLLHPVRDWAGHRRFREEELISFRAKLLNGDLSGEERQHA